jgi:hypothetical protein
MVEPTSSTTAANAIRHTGGRCQLAAGNRGLPSALPESVTAPQLFLMLSREFEFIVDQWVEHGPTLGLPVSDAIVWTR